MKTRIKKVKFDDGEVLYYPQRRCWGIWGNIRNIQRADGTRSFCPRQAYHEAKQDIENYLKWKTRYLAADTEIIKFW